MIKCQNTYQLSFIRKIDLLSDLEILYLTFILRCSLSLFKFSFLNYSRMVPSSSLSLEMTCSIQSSAVFARPLPGLDRPRSSISNLSRARYSNVDRSLLDTFYSSELVEVDIKYPHCAIIAKLLAVPNGFSSQHIL